jgi:predicted metal-dependent peptidase
MADTMRAAQQAATMRGTVPSAVSDVLGELMKPTLKFTDIVRSACMKKVQDAGLKNDWKRFRRRWISGGRGRIRQYLPKRHTHRPRWLAMIDTSGSMSQDDLVYGLSQLKVLGNGTEGFVVPCDAAIHWEGLTPVRNMDDIARTKIVGRGGTVFDDFFREFPEKLGLEFDCVVVITDGDCGTVPKELRPPLDVVWVITRERDSFKPSFGRVAPLRNERL